MKPQAAWNKNEQKFWQYFLAWYFMLFPSYSSPSMYISYLRCQTKDIYDSNEHSSRSYNHPTNVSKTYCVRWSRSLSWRMSTSWRSTSTSTKGSSYNSSLKHSSQVNYINTTCMTSKMLNPMTRFCSRYADAYDRRDRSGRPEGSSGCCVKIRTLHPLQWTSHWRRAHRRQR